MRRYEEFTAPTAKTHQAAPRFGDAYTTVRSD
jgi:hypothetical protein